MSGPGAHLQPLLRQWGLLLAAVALGLCITIWYGALWREDLLLYDAALTYRRAPDDIVIVAIDDASLAAIGRWPWRRGIHAALLQQLQTAGVRGVILDVLFTEPDPIAPADDALLAATMAQGPPTILPMMVDWQHAALGLHETLPIASLAASAAGLGHAHLEIDRDGIARSVFLREGVGRPNRSQLALALLEAIHAPGPERLPGERAPAGAPRADVWLRDYHVLIPFLGPPGRFRQVSYVDVLRGRVPAAQLRGKLVLVGATAQGLGDAYPTPSSGEGIAMPGIEISANILTALREGRAIHPVSRGGSMLLALLPLLAAFAGFLRLSPRHALAAIATLALATVAASLLMLRLAGWWWSPAAALLALLVAYPLWSWRRLEAAQVYLDEELAHLDQEPLPLTPSSAPRRAAPQLSDALQRRIHRVRDATARLRHLRRLLGVTVAALPDAVLLVDLEGRVVLANPGAATLFSAALPAALDGRTVDSLLAPLLADVEIRYPALATHAPAAVEFAAADGRDLMLRVAPFKDGNGARAGSVVEITDVSALKAGERERDDTIRFLSHDMRSPSSSLLGLAQMLRDPARAPSPVDTAQRIETLARRTLALADGFIALARAHFIEPTRFDEVDLADAMQDAVDEVWATAAARQVAVAAPHPAPAARVHGDRHMLARAISNLLSNAVKHSPGGGTVQLQIQQAAGAWVLSVRDRGPGIAPERHAQLFQRFQRAVHHGETDPGGVGLGLALVRVVAQKHGGAVEVESAAGQGATFRLIVPATADGAASGAPARS